MQPNLKSMEAHYDSKHSKIKFDEELKGKYEGAFADAKAGCPQRFF